LTSDKVYCEPNGTELQQLDGKFLSFFTFFFWEIRMKLGQLPMR